MHVPREQELLKLWESVTDLPADYRALALLAAAHPELSWQQPEQLTVGERDRRLLGLRARLFGANAEMLACCPACGERVEGLLPVLALSEGGPGAEQYERSLNVGRHRVGFRPPTAGDLLEIAHCPPEHARARLLERCVHSVIGPEEQPLAVEALPDPVLTAVIAAMEEADTNAWLEAEFTCVSCGQSWHTVFDIARYLWRE